MTKHSKHVQDMHEVNISKEIAELRRWTRPKLKNLDNPRFNWVLGRKEASNRALEIIEKLKDKLDIATRTAETNEIYLRKVFAELQNKIDRVATLDDLEMARMICKKALDMCEERNEKILEQLNKN